MKSPVQVKEEDKTFTPSETRPLYFTELNRFRVPFIFSVMTQGPGTGHVLKDVTLETDSLTWMSPLSD